MIDLGQIAAAVGSLKAAGDIAQGLISLKTMADVQAVSIKLNQQLIAAQHQIFAANAAQTALVERVRELEGQIAAMKDWDAQKQRYQMVVPFSGCTVYALKQSMSEGEAAHYLCANCFQSGKRSFLQAVKSKDHWVHYVCAACKAEMDTGYRGVGPASYAEAVKTET